MLQVLPPQPKGQLHRKESPWSKHVPPLLQVVGSHWLSPAPKKRDITLHFFFFDSGPAFSSNQFISKVQFTDAVRVLNKPAQKPANTSSSEGRLERLNNIRPDM